MHELHKIKSGFKKAEKTYTQSAIAQNQVCLKLSRLIKKFETTTPENILEIGAGFGMLTKILAAEYQMANWTINDLEINPDIFYKIFETHPTLNLIEGNAEDIFFHNTYDLIISASAIQWFNEPTKFALNIKNYISPGGIIAVSTYGPQNLREIKEITGNGLNYFSMEEYSKNISQSDYEILHQESEIIELYFNSPCEILQHIKHTGVNGSFRQFWTPKKMSDFTLQYEKFRHHNKTYKLSYNPIYLILKKK